MRLFSTAQGGIIMLPTQTVEAGTLVLIKELMSDKELESFNLVGGTTLSLKLGHRMSVDIDLFTDWDFHAHQISRHLAQTYNPENIKTLKMVFSVLLMESRKIYLPINTLY